jgi:undecaprenyl diphosphate synthase
MGHKKGADTVRMVIESCLEWKIPYLTLYAFSQENWKRPKAEIKFLMNLLDHFLEVELESLRKEGVQFRTIGILEALPESSQKKIQRMKDLTAGNQRLVLNVALNYGARSEIVHAAKRLFRDKARLNGDMARSIEALDENEFERYLDTAGMPDPDLLIRTSGEMRLSNFLLWQCSYSEFYSSKKLWPEFKKDDFIEAIQDYAKRNRRFGAIA